MPVLTNWFRSGHHDHIDVGAMKDPVNQSTIDSIGEFHNEFHQ